MILVVCVDHSDVVRHFALQVLEASITKSWNTMDVTARRSMQCNVMSILFDRTRGMVEERGYIKVGS